MLQRLVHKADFERLLASRSRLRSAHFALHHVAGSPAVPEKPARLLKKLNLSTGQVNNSLEPVENLAADHWLGCVVPKRYAKRSVTRSLFKRQMRSVFEKHAASLPTGLWLLRLSQGFLVTDFVSARSQALAQAVRMELDVLLANQQKRDRKTPGQQTGTLPQAPTQQPAGGPTVC
jgi:ribonuclease P protein component